MLKWNDIILMIFFIIIIIVSIIIAVRISFCFCFCCHCNKSKNHEENEKVTELIEVNEENKKENEENKKEDEENIKENEENIKENEENIKENEENIKENEEKNVIGDYCISFNCNIDVKFAFTFLGRLIITIYSFHGLFFLYNFIFQNLALVALLFFYWDHIACQIFVTIFNIFIAILTSNVLVVPTFDFLSFPFLKPRNPLSHFYTFNQIFFDDKNFDSKQIIESNKPIINYLLILISFLYISGYILALISNITLFKNFIELFLLFFAYSYYLILFFCYAFTSIFIIYKMYKNKNYFKEHILPDINLLSYSINPIYKDNYKGKIIDSDGSFFDIRNILRMIIGVLLLVVNLFSWLNIEIKSNYIIFHIIIHIMLHSVLIIFVFSISIALNFPFCYKNTRNLDGFRWFFNSKIELIKEPKNPILLSAVRFVCNLLFFLISSVLCLAFFIMKDKLNEDLMELENFTEISKNKIDPKYNLLPSISVP